MLRVAPRARDQKLIWAKLKNFLRLSHIYQFFSAGYSSTEIQRTCKRCQLNVIESDGVYNILVENVRLGVDEYYECQVSPGKGATNSVPLRAPVHITIQGKETVVEYLDVY